jgi:hypothetical protein
VPIAIPTSADARPGASLIPSPTIATGLPSSWNDGEKHDRSTDDEHATHRVPSGFDGPTIAAGIVDRPDGGANAGALDRSRGRRARPSGRRASSRGYPKGGIVRRSPPGPRVTNALSREARSRPARGVMPRGSDRPRRPGVPSSQAAGERGRCRNGGAVRRGEGAGVADVATGLTGP